MKSDCARLGNKDVKNYFSQHFSNPTVFFIAHTLIIKIYSKEILSFLRSEFTKFLVE